MNETTKQKIAYSLRNRKHSATHTKRIAESLKGKSKSPNHKKAISDAMKNLWEQRRKVTICQEDKTCNFADRITK